jgi:rhodanese-related sulfurtransferase
MHLEDPPPGIEEGLEVETPVPGSLLLDVREPGEFAGGVGQGALLLPMDLVPHHLDALPRDRPITVYCAAGARSAGVAHWLREQGWAGAVSLAGGIGALRYGGVDVVVPPGVRPGTRLWKTPTEVEGVGAVGPQDVEVIEQAGEWLRVRFYDGQGLQVLGRVKA